MRFLVVGLVIGALALAQGKRSFTGKITDSMCATADHSQMRMGPTDGECTIACVEAHGASYVLYDGKKAYTLSDQKTPEKFAGKMVTRSICEFAEEQLPRAHLRERPAAQFTFGRVRLVTVILRIDRNFHREAVTAARTVLADTLAKVSVCARDEERGFDVIPFLGAQFTQRAGARLRKGNCQRIDRDGVFAESAANILW